MKYSSLLEPVSCFSFVNMYGIYFAGIKFCIFRVLEKFAKLKSAKINLIRYPLGTHGITCEIKNHELEF